MKLNPFSWRLYECEICPRILKLVLNRLKCIVPVRVPRGVRRHAVFLSVIVGAIVLTAIVSFVLILLSQLSLFEGTDGTGSKYSKFMSYFSAPVDYMSRIRDCYQINEFPNEFEIRPDDTTCNGMFSGSVILCLMSPVKDFKAREDVRTLVNAWKLPVQLLFFTGKLDRKFKGGQENIQKLIRLEANLTDDIVQSSFNDFYSGVNVKTVAILKWITEHCHWAPSFVVITTATRVNRETGFETRLDLLSGEMKLAAKKYPHFLVGPLHGNGLSVDDVAIDDDAASSPSYCQLYPRLAIHRWRINFAEELRSFPVATAKILYEASKRNLWAARPKCDVTGLTAAMVGIPFVRLWAFWPYTIKGEAFRQNQQVIIDHPY